MKDRPKKRNRIIKKVVNAMVNHDAREWPPTCIGFFYQPSRPQNKTIEKKPEKAVRTKHSTK